MRVFKPFSTLLFVMLCIQGPTIFSSSQAYAWSCCGCSCRAVGCYCPGQGGCIWYPCHAIESPTLQAQSLTNNERLDITGSYSSSPSPSQRSYNIDRLIARASSDQCVKNELARKFFYSAEDRLAVAEDLLSFKTGEDNAISVVATQMAPKEER